MKPMIMERLLVISLVAAAVLWAGCLTILWGWALDSSGGTTLTALAATMLALSVAVRLPRRAAWGAQRLLSWLEAREPPGAGRFSETSDREVGTDGRTLTRLLGLAAALTLLGAILSSLALPVVAAAADWLTRCFLWGQLTWALAKGVIQLAVVFPLALGLSVLFLVTALIRHGSRRDGYATTCRNWTYGAALGMAMLGLAWTAGLNLLLVMAAAGIMLAFAAVLLLWRARPALRSRRFAGPVEASRQVSRRVWVAACAAGLAASLLLQFRLLCDIGAIGMAGRLAWAAGSMGALAAFMGRTDGKARPPAAASSLAATIGIVSGLVMQSALAMTCLWAQAAEKAALAAVSAGLAVAAQVPLAALTGMILSRQRRLFAAAGGSARAFFADATAGAGAGFLTCATVMAFHAGRAAFLVVMFGALTGGVLGGMFLGAQGRRALKWAAAGAVLFCSLVAAVLVPIGRLGRWVGAISPGICLSAVIRQDVDGSWQLAGCLPLAPPWRAESVTAAAEQILSAGEHRGRWWVLATSSRDVPIARHGIRMTVSLPGLTGRAGAQDALSSNMEMFPQTRIMRQSFDGILMCPLPADHPQAWRWYNERAMQACLDRLHRDGCMILRTQAGLDELDKALAVAKTFHQVVGSGWAIGEVSRDRLDLLLAGPESAVQCPAVGEEAFAVPLRRLWERWPGIRAILMASPSDAGKAVSARGQAP